VHRHTLQRALKASGCSFQSMKQALILERFDCHLADGQAVPLKQVWAGLGFPSASALARYIRRATGKSPTELRADCVLGHLARRRSGMSLDPQAGGG